MAKNLDDIRNDTKRQQRKISRMIGRIIKVKPSVRILVYRGALSAKKLTVFNCPIWLTLGVSRVWSMNPNEVHSKRHPPHHTKSPQKTIFGEWKYIKNLKNNLCVRKIMVNLPKSVFIGRRCRDCGWSLMSKFLSHEVNINIQLAELKKIPNGKKYRNIYVYQKWLQPNVRMLAHNTLSCMLAAACVFLTTI